MELLKLNIQMFADGKVVIETDLNDSGFKNGLNKIMQIVYKNMTCISLKCDINKKNNTVKLLFVITKLYF